MNEKVESKNVDKICPLFGAVPKQFLGKDVASGRVIQLGVEMQITACQKDKCELWDKANERCSISLLAWHISCIEVHLEDMSQGIRDIVEYAKTLKEVTSGKS